MTEKIAGRKRKSGTLYADRNTEGGRGERELRNWL